MKKSTRNELISELKDIRVNGIQFFKDSSVAFEGVHFRQPFGSSYERDEFWGNLPDHLQKVSSSLISRIINIAPTIAEASRLTPYLTKADQIDLGNAIKGIRSALYLCRYRYWDTEVLHDEGIVLGVQAAGQSDDEGIYPDQALQVFEECYRRITNIIELVNPISIENAEQNIEMRGQSSTVFQPDTAFVMMWIDQNHPELEDVHNTVKRCFNEFGINAERADDIEHEGLITEQILDKIKSSEFLYADLSGARPSVYYEVGFAHAIHKRVLLFRRAGEKIHFDLAGYNCPEYKNLTDLEKQLRKRLSHMTGKKIAKEQSEQE